MSGRSGYTPPLYTIRKTVAPLLALLSLLFVLYGCKYYGVSMKDYLEYYTKEIFVTSSDFEPSTDAASNPRIYKAPDGTIILQPGELTLTFNLHNEKNVPVTPVLSGISSKNPDITYTASHDNSAQTITATVSGLVEGDHGALTLSFPTADGLRTFEPETLPRVLVNARPTEPEEARVQTPGVDTLVVTWVMRPEEDAENITRVEIQTTDGFRELARSVGGWTTDVGQHLKVVDLGDAAGNKEFEFDLKTAFTLNTSSITAGDYDVTVRLYDEYDQCTELTTNGNVKISDRPDITYTSNTVTGKVSITVDKKNADKAMYRYQRPGGSWTDWAEYTGPFDVDKGLRAEAYTTTDGSFRSRTMSVVADGFNLTLNGNGGTLADGNTTKVSIWDRNKTITLPKNEFTKVGHSFSGWATSPTDTVAAYVDGDSYTTADPSGTATLYAVWEEKAYKAIFHANAENVSGTMAELPFTVTNLPELTANQFIRNGYIFDGWSTTASSNDVTYTDKQKLNMDDILAADANGDKLDLYAVWNLDNYTLQYYNGSTPIPGLTPETYDVNSPVPLPAKAVVEAMDLKPSYYSFAGWYEQEDFSGSSVAEIPQGSTGNKKFYAKWNCIITEDGISEAIQNGETDLEFSGTLTADDTAKLYEAIRNSTTPGLKLDFSNATLTADVIEGSGTNRGKGFPEPGFKDCANITEIILPTDGSITALISFSGMTSLERITIPDSVVYVGGSIFQNCTSLTEVTIGSNVNHIGTYAFERCSSLTKVTFKDTSDWNAVDVDSAGRTPINVTDSSNNAANLIDGNQWMEKELHKN